MKFRLPFSASLPRCLRRLALLGSALWLAPVAGHADTASVVTAANTYLSVSGQSTTSYTLTDAKHWTNLPGGTRNGPTIGGGPAALSTDLSDTVASGQTLSPRAAAIALAQTALSDAGYHTMNEIRNADDEIRSTDNTQSWNYGNYHIAILGTPSTTAPWMLQISGHHLTYNITYNGPYVGATPMFIGTEPVKYYTIGTDLTSTQEAVVKGTINGVTTYLISYPYNSSSSTTSTTTDPGISSATVRAPLETQRAAVSALATSIQADSTNASAGKLSGTFSDVVLGVTNSGDGNFPFVGTTVTYPTGTTGRGVQIASMTARCALRFAHRDGEGAGQDDDRGVGQHSGERCLLLAPGRLRERRCSRADVRGLSGGRGQRGRRHHAVQLRRGHLHGSGSV